MTLTPEQILSQLEDTASLLQRAQVNLKKCPKQRLTQGYIDARLRCIEEYWQTFKTHHAALVKCTSKDERGAISYFVNEDYYTCEDLYINLQADFKDILLLITKRNTERGESSTTTSETSSQVKLPKIQLPIFSGKYEDWPTFQDLYTSLVHNNTSISKVEKLHYLKTSVAGEPASLLKHIQVTENSYLQAWETLEQRYGNKRVIANTIMTRMFNQKKLTSQSATQIKSLLDTTVECLNNLKNLNINTDSWDPIIIYLLVQKLDPESHKDWEEYAFKENSDEMPKWDELKKFLESKFRTLELLAPTAVSTPREKTLTRSYHTATPEKTCILCQDKHNLCHCKEFGRMNATERSKYVKDNRLCFNCLLPGHPVYKCRVPMSCRICQRRHHSLLHEPRNQDTSGQTEDSMQPTVSAHSKVVGEQDRVEHITSHHASNRGTALLATALVPVRGENGTNTMLRALIDQGSQACFISEKAAQQLKLRRQPARGAVFGVGSTRTNINQVVQLKVLSRKEADFSLNIQAYVMSKQLTTKIPHNIIAGNDWHHLEGLELADPSYHTPGSIDLLLGVKEYALILKDELVKGPPGTPCAQNTNLGWILFGEINTNKIENTFLVMHHQVEVQDMLKTLWEIDQEPTRKLTREERRCEEIYNATTTRNKEGRYIVEYPFKTEEPESPNGNTREKAKQRLHQLERRFTRQPKLREEYTNVIEEYESLGHMERVPEIEINAKSVYLPHHAVVREEKESSKTRIVFDASNKGTNNISLNDELLVGPVLQDDLRSIIMRWRLHAVCYISDIKKMFRNILVSSKQTDYQRILWRNNPADEIIDYRLLTVTFGTASAPYLAVRTLIQLADDEGDKYPIAAKIIKEEFYVDDVCSGCDTVEQAIEASRQLKEIMQRGGFELTKWSSNSIEFMKSIPANERSSNADIDLNKDGTVKALGVIWNLRTDRFQYNLNLSTMGTEVTKRNILSDIQKLFDPLGWIAPSIVLAKILIQKLWAEKVGWDESLSLPLATEWMTIRNDLENVNEIHIDRWLHTSNINKQSIQIHGFSDASERAYAATVYVRVTQEDGTNVVKLIAARTRVAPLKTISLPRLELCGALLLSRLVKHVGQALKIPDVQTYAWTDSTIVLSWIAGEPARWKLFVANRVVEITENIPYDKWFHVQSQDNPADIASRGMLVSNLKTCQLWFEGPRWLKDNKIALRRPDDIDTDLDSRKEKINTNLNVTAETENKEERSLIEQFEQFDDLKELIRTITLCTRFLNYKKIKDTEVPFTTDELEKTLQTCIKLTQGKEFEEEIEALKNKYPVKKRSKLKSLNPYLDENEILRVGGRLQHADISYESKHPIILNNKNRLTNLIIAEAHLRTLHGGVQLTMSYLRSKYWIIRAKALVKSHIHKCLTCAKHSATAKTQIMGELPKVRVTPARAFLRSGVDFAGPFQVLFSRGRGAKTSKAYIAIFICMATKAIHLELVGDMTSQSFIGAYKRFVARRGRCSDLWSDQGKNFVGANKELQEAWQESKLEFTGEIADSLSSDGTQWHFIPAYSPNFGGLWEAGVKSVKYHLKRILTTNLTFEEMTTVLCEIEACLNSRPLCPIDETDTDNMDILTPGHFLIGETPRVIPSPNLHHITMSTLSRWQHTQKLIQDFWKRWVQEYLTRLQQRPKWMRKKDEFKTGQIVLIKIENLPPGKWALGRITDKHPGPDGFTRVYSVKSGNNIIKRSVTKLCYLPIDSDTD